MFYRRGPVLAIILVFLGIGLIINCIRGLASREGMYDQESSSYMFWGQVLGVVLGVGMLAAAILMIRTYFWF